MLCICYVHNKYIILILFVRGSMKCTFRITCVSQLSVHPFTNITPDNREYTLFCFTDDICGEMSYLQLLLNHLISFTCFTLIHCTDYQNDWNICKEACY